MSIISTVAPAGIASGPQSNVLAQAVLQAQTASGTGPTAQLLMPSAVVSSPVVPPYQPQTPREPSTAAARSLPSQPQAPLAAQVIAQTPEVLPRIFLFLEPRNQSAATAIVTASSTGTTAATLKATVPLASPVTSAPASTARAPQADSSDAKPKRTSNITRGLTAYQVGAVRPQTQFTERAVEALV